MKHLHIWLIVSFLILLQVNCVNKSHSQIRMQHKGDSIIVASFDSTSLEDPWIKYSYSERQGKRLFELYCVVCHGKDGGGDGFNAYNLNPRPHSLADTSYMKVISIETLTEIISYGGKSLNKSVMMPGYVFTLNKNQISDLISFIETFTRPKLMSRLTHD